MPLLERESALETLGGWFAEARAGRGRLVLVGGEAGVGKTTLVEAFTVRHRQASRVLRGACDPLTTPRPLGPLADVAPALDGRLDQLLRDEAAREVVFPALLERLRDSRVLTVLVIEDVHWADEATLDLLRFLARRLGASPALLVVTYRDDEVGPLHPVQLLAGDLASSALVRRLRLAPLSRQAVAVLASPHGVDPAALHERTGGNPFFVTEVLAAGDASIPATVVDAVLARAARLSPPARHVLDAAAVVAPPVETWLLAEAAGAAPGHLDECVAAGMLQAQASGGVGFRHELARLAVEGALGPGRRADLHGRALAALLARPGAAPDPARLAHHADGAGNAAAVLESAPEAARRAAALGAHREAAAQYARALRFAEGLAPAALAELLERHSYECYLTDQLAAAAASRERALSCWRALGDRRKEGDTLRWLSRIAWYQGRNADAERAGREAVELLEGLAPGPELAMAYSNLSQLDMLAGKNDEALAWGRRAIELAESLGQTEILVHALNNVGTVDWCQGRPAGRHTLERSLALALAHGLEEHAARAYTNLAFSALNLRDYPLASRYFDEGVRCCTERDLDTWRLYMLASQARADFEQGRWTEATRTVETVLRDPRTAPISRIEALAVLGRLRARRGDPGVWPPPDEALALATVTGELQRLGPVAIAHAEAAWLQGDPAAARRWWRTRLTWPSGSQARPGPGRPARLPSGCGGWADPTGFRPAGCRTGRPSRSRCRWPAPWRLRPTAGGRSAARTRPPLPSPTAIRSRSSVRPWPSSSAWAPDPWLPRSPASCGSWESGG